MPYPLLANSLLGSQDLLKSHSEAIQMIPASWVSPYGLGHKVNHPAPGGYANCLLLDIEVPAHFFDLEFLRHLPCIPYS